jgi:hypothetical protein
VQASQFSTVGTESGLNIEEALSHTRGQPVKAFSSKAEVVLSKNNGSQLFAVGTRETN